MTNPSQLNGTILYSTNQQRYPLIPVATRAANPIPLVRNTLQQSAAHETPQPLAPSPVPECIEQQRIDSAANRTLKRKAIAPLSAQPLQFKVAVTPASYMKDTKPDHALNPSSHTGALIKAASEHIHRGELKEAIVALTRSFCSLPCERFIYPLLVGLDGALHNNTDPWVTSRQEDIDLLLLQGIYNIKHSKFQDAKMALQKVLTRNENDKFAELLFNYASKLSERPRGMLLLNLEMEPVTQNHLRSILRQKRDN